jgi:hypothetical protein
MEIEPYIELVEKEVRTIKLEVGIELMVVAKVKIIKIVVEETNV